MQENKPLLVGITGGIGSGKSLVCRIFQTLGVPVYDADTKARWLMENDTQLQQEIIKNFGSESYRDGVLQREYLGKLVFPDPEKLKVLNSLTHPAVGRHFGQWVTENKNRPYLIKEAALFIESGTYKALDRLILVTAPLNLKLERIKARDPHRNEADILTVIERQMSDEEKRKFCQYEIVNDNSTPVLKTVLELDKQFRKLSDQLAV